MRCTEERPEKDLCPCLGLKKTGDVFKYVGSLAARWKAERGDT